MACWIDKDNRVRVTLPSQFKRHRHDGCWLCWLMRVLRDLAGRVRPYWHAHLCRMGLGHSFDPCTRACYGCKRDWHDIERSWNCCAAAWCDAIDAGAKQLADAIDAAVFDEVWGRLVKPFYPREGHGDVVIVRPPGRYFPHA